MHSVVSAVVVARIRIVNAKILIITIMMATTTTLMMLMLMMTMMCDGEGDCTFTLNYEISLLQNYFSQCLVMIVYLVHAQLIIKNQHCFTVLLLSLIKINVVLDL